MIFSSLSFQHSSVFPSPFTPKILHMNDDVIFSMSDFTLMAAISRLHRVVQMTSLRSFASWIMSQVLILLMCHFDWCFGYSKGSVLFFSVHATKPLIQFRTSVDIQTAVYRHDTITHFAKFNISTMSMGRIVRKAQTDLLIFQRKTLHASVKITVIYDIPRLEFDLKVVVWRSLTF